MIRLTIFLLSIDEAKKFFNFDLEKIAKYNCTVVAVEWWLRTSSLNDNHADRVNSLGIIDYNGGFVDSPKHGVRPAMWISI